MQSAEDKKMETKPKIADMHIHSNQSDGRLTPEEIIRMAQKIPHLAAIAITDHDTPEGSRRALAYGSKRLEIIPAIEFSCVRYGEEVHILGYYIDIDDHGLLQTEEKMLAFRAQRAEQFVEKLNENHIGITLSDVYRYAGGKAVGRPHIAQAILSGGYVQSLEEGYQKYLSPQSATYVPRQKMPVEEALKLIENAGGCSVLAHPVSIQNQSLVDEVIALGIKGLEVYHPTHTAQASEHYFALAQQHGLYKTGGSDFHFANHRRHMLIGQCGIDCEEVRRMREVYGKTK